MFVNSVAPLPIAHLKIERSFFYGKDRGKERAAFNVHFKQLALIRQPDRQKSAPTFAPTCGVFNAIDANIKTIQIHEIVLY